MSTINTLQPEIIWKHFTAILSIPHESKNEEKLRTYVIECAARHNCQTKVDSTGNVVVRIPGSSGREQEPVIVLQSHLDMVCVKLPEKVHNFTTDPVPVRIEGDRLIGDGTTLGADNGIGVAIMLAVMDDTSLSHGPLELLFTVDEEAGMSGAHHLEPGFIEGRRLINLDTEEWGEFYISCAGGGDAVVTLPINRTDFPEGRKVFKLRIEGLKGGHSGVDINRGRLSAIKVLSRLLWHINRRFNMDLIKLQGGSKRNVIASEAEALFILENTSEEELNRFLMPLAEIIRNEHSSSETNMSLSLQVLDATAGMRIMLHLSTEKTLDLLQALPHGVLAMSADVAGLVETSCNLGVLKTDDHSIQAVLLCRSAITSKVEASRDMIEAIVKLAGGSVERPLGYPGWKPNPNSELLAMAQKVYNRQFGKEASVKAIHAGLECGIIGEKYPGIDMLSIGPDISGAHTVGENVSVSSVEKFWSFLKSLLAEK